MYFIEASKNYQKSYKKLKASGKLKETTEKELKAVINTLAQGERLAIQYKDHQLTGDLKAYRECHVQGNLLLVYEIIKGKLVLVLVDIGSHSYLFG